MRVAAFASRTVRLLSAVSRIQKRPFFTRTTLLLNGKNGESTTATIELSQEDYNKLSKGKDHFMKGLKAEQSGDYRSAQTHYASAHGIYQASSHPQAYISLISVSKSLAALAQRQAQFEKAAEYFEEAVSLCESHLEVHHPATFTSYSSVASVYVELKRYREAEEILLDLLKLSKLTEINQYNWIELTGSDFPHVLATVHYNLAITYARTTTTKKKEQLNSNSNSNSNSSNSNSNNNNSNSSNSNSNNVMNTTGSVVGGNSNSSDETTTATATTTTATAGGGVGSSLVQKTLLSNQDISVDDEFDSDRLNLADGQFSQASTLFSTGGSNTPATALYASINFREWSKVLADLGFFEKAKEKLMATLQLQQQIDADALAIVETLNTLIRVTMQSDSTPKDRLAESEAILYCIKLSHQCIKLLEGKDPTQIQKGYLNSFVAQLELSGVLHYEKGLLKESVPYFERALQVKELLVNPQSSDYAFLVNTAAFNILAAGDTDTASVLFDRAAGLYLRFPPNNQEHAENAHMALDIYAELLDERGEKQKAKWARDQSQAMLTYELVKNAHGRGGRDE